MLSAQLLHRNFLGGGEPDFISDAPDIIIRSTSHQISYSHTIKPLAYESLARLRLHEDENWRVSATDRGGGGGDHAGNMQEVLKDVHCFLIRC